MEGILSPIIKSTHSSTQKPSSQLLPNPIFNKVSNKRCDSHVTEMLQGKNIAGGTFLGKLASQRQKSNYPFIKVISRCMLTSSIPETTFLVNYQKLHVRVFDVSVFS